MSEAVQQKLDYEFGVIRCEGLHLLLPDRLGLRQLCARSRGMRCVARGSAAGSLVAYVLGITNVDPLRYDLLFERFLNPERMSMPDIDMDFPDDRREEVIRYVADKYGWDRVAPDRHLQHDGRQSRRARRWPRDGHAERGRPAWRG